MLAVTQHEEEKKLIDNGDYINLKVNGQDGVNVFFKINKTTKLRKLMNAYCVKRSVDFYAITFLFNGHRLRAEQTPDEREMKDGDEIDAMMHPIGGGYGLA